MAIFQWMSLTLTVLTSLALVTYGEIHRSKTNSPRTSAKTGKPNFSYVSKKLDSATAADLQLGIMTDAGIMTEFRYDTWCYSIIGAGLVGLSGIFPLLVIPIEAGPSLKHGAAASRLKLLLSFAVGGLLGDVFLHLLPEAWQHLDKDDHAAHVNLGLWVITGMLSFLIIEKAFAKEDEFEHLQDECDEWAAEQQQQQLDQSQDAAVTYSEPTDLSIKHPDLMNEMRSQREKQARDNSAVANRTRSKSKLTNGAINGGNEYDTNSVNGTVTRPLVNGTNSRSVIKSTVNSSVSKSENKENKNSSIKVSGYLNLAANVIDNFTHGLAVAGGFLVSNKVGFITTLAILLHEIPHEVGDFAILLRSGFDRWKAAKAQLLTATGGMVGALTALTADSAKAAGDSTAWILPFTSGGFIYIAMVTVVPDLLEETHPRESTKQTLCLLAGIAVMYLVCLVH